MTTHRYLMDEHEARRLQQFSLGPYFGKGTISVSQETIDMIRQLRLTGRCACSSPFAPASTEELTLDTTTDL